MRTPVSDPEINAAMDDVRKAVERFIDLGFKCDCARAVTIDSALMNVRTVITDAILAAFPRAEDDCRRSHLILMLDAISPPDHEEALALLRRLAAEDPDAEVRPLSAGTSRIAACLKRNRIACVRWVSGIGVARSAPALPADVGRQTVPAARSSRSDCGSRSDWPSTRDVMRPVTTRGLRDDGADGRPFEARAVRPGDS